MANQPSPPPEDRSEGDAEREGPEPFFNVTGNERGTVTVRAGWVEDDEVVSLVLQYSGSVAQAESAMMTGFSWYVNTLKGLAEGG